MIPYVVILVFIVAIILWHVYKQSEYFTTGAFVPFSVPLITETSTMRALMDNLLSIVKKFYELKSMYSGRSFKPKIMEDEARALQMTVSKDATGSFTILGDSSVDTLKKIINDEITNYEGQIAAAERDVKMAATRIDAKVGDAIMADSTISADRKAQLLKSVLDGLNAANEGVAKKINALMSIYYREYPLATTPATPLVPAITTTPVTTSTTTTGPLVTRPIVRDEPTKNVLASDMDITLTKPKESPITSQPAAAEKETPVLIKEIEDRLAKNIASQLKDEVLSQLRLQGALDNSMSPQSCDTPMPSSDSIAQGREYTQTQRAQTQQPDLTKYIKKDSIPCWGCTLDY